MIEAEKQEANMPKICALYNVKRIPEKLIFSTHNVYCELVMQFTFQL